MSELQLSALLIEDDDRLARFTADFLEQNGVCVTRCGDGEEGLAAALRKTYDAVILDLMLPRRDGLDVCKRIRAHSNVPIIVVTARVDEVDRLLGFEVGADDYLPKPFDLSELEARLRALHRRSLGVVHSLLRVGVLEYDTVSRRFAVGARHLDLPPREHDLLEALITHSSRPVSKNLLADSLRSSDAVLSHDALEVYVHRLRRRLDGSGAAIHTLRGLGYVLEASDDPPA